MALEWERTMGDGGGVGEARHADGILDDAVLATQERKVGLRPATRHTAERSSGGERREMSGMILGRWHRLHRRIDAIRDG